jgi:hypothetical protein
MRNFKNEILDDLERRFAGSARAELYEASRLELETLIERHVAEAARRIEDDLRRFKRRMLVLDISLAIVLAWPVAIAADLAVKHWPEIQAAFLELFGQ